MGVFDKIKNALFEEEYVEVEEKPKTKSKPRREKPKRENREVKVHENKPIAKKVILPEKKEEVEESFDDYAPEEEDFEIVPDRDEKEPTSEFKFPAIDDQEFREENNYSEPKIVEVVEKETVKMEERPVYHHTKPESELRSSRDESELYHGRKDSNLYHSKNESNLYHSDYNSTVSIHEYGTYEKKETKPVFKPSPIISPIYGILDKDYKKEEIVPKREVRLTSYSREHMSVDDVRRKAYGNLADDIVADINGKVSTEDISEEKEEIEENSNLLVDLSDDSEKPRVSEVTMGDAEEYFRDLGLEYNIDYKDSSKEKATGRRVTESYDEDEKVATAITKESDQSVESTKDPASDDNLFDLIDSMYEDEEEKE